MIVALAMLLAGQPLSSCRSVGSAVQCALAPARVMQVSLTKPAPFREARPVVVERRRVRPVAEVAVKPKSAPTPREETASSEDVHRHIGTLVTIGDCTGARTYATLIGQADLAEKTFKACIGG